TCRAAQRARRCWRSSPPPARASPERAVGGVPTPPRRGPCSGRPALRLPSDGVKEFTPSDGLHAERNLLPTGGGVLRLARLAAWGGSGESASPLQDALGSGTSPSRARDRGRRGTAARHTRRT